MGKNVLYIYLICFGVTYKKIFLRLLTEQNWIILKNITHVDRTPPKNFKPSLTL